MHPLSIQVIPMHSLSVQVVPMHSLSVQVVPMHPLSVQVRIVRFLSRVFKYIQKVQLFESVFAGLDNIFSLSGT